MIKFEKIKPGMILYDCHKHTMGNTTIKVMGTWTVYIKEVYPDTRKALVSWNHNPPTIWNEKRLTKLRAKLPKDKE